MLLLLIRGKMDDKHRKISKIMRVGRELLVLLDITILTNKPSENSTSWFTDREMMTMLMLLRDPIYKRIEECAKEELKQRKRRKHGDVKKSTAPPIKINSERLKVGLQFRRHSVSRTCMLPKEQPRGCQDSDNHSGGGCDSMILFPEKLQVIVRENPEHELSSSHRLEEELSRPTSSYFNTALNTEGIRSAKRKKLTLKRIISSSSNVSSNKKFGALGGGFEADSTERAAKKDAAANQGEDNTRSETVMPLLSSGGVYTERIYTEVALKESPDSPDEEPVQSDHGLSLGVRDREFEENSELENKGKRPTNMVGRINEGQITENGDTFLRQEVIVQKPEGEDKGGCDHERVASSENEKREKNEKGEKNGSRRAVANAGDIPISEGILISSQKPYLENPFSDTLDNGSINENHLENPIEDILDNGTIAGSQHSVVAEKRSAKVTEINVSDNSAEEETFNLDSVSCDENSHLHHSSPKENVSKSNTNSSKVCKASKPVDEAVLVGKEIPLREGSSQRTNKLSQNKLTISRRTIHRTNPKELTEKVDDHLDGHNNGHLEEETQNYSSDHSAVFNFKTLHVKNTGINRRTDKVQSMDARVVPGIVEETAVPCNKEDNGVTGSSSTEGKRKKRKLAKRLRRSSRCISFSSSDEESFNVDLSEMLNPRTKPQKKRFRLGKKPTEKRMANGGRKDPDDVSKCGDSSSSDETSLPATSFLLAGPTLNPDSETCKQTSDDTSLPATGFLSADPPSNPDTGPDGQAGGMDRNKHTAVAELLKVDVNQNISLENNDENVISLQTDLVEDSGDEDSGISLASRAESNLITESSKPSQYSSERQLSRKSKEDDNYQHCPVGIGTIDGRLPLRGAENGKLPYDSFLEKEKTSGKLSFQRRRPRNMKGVNGVRQDPGDDSAVGGALSLRGAENLKLPDDSFLGKEKDKISGKHSFQRRRGKNRKGVDGVRQDPGDNNEADGVLSLRGAESLKLPDDLFLEKEDDNEGHQRSSRMKPLGKQKVKGVSHLPGTDDVADELLSARKPENARLPDDSFFEDDGQIRKHCLDEVTVHKVTSSVPSSKSCLLWNNASTYHRGANAGQRITERGGLGQKTKPCDTNESNSASVNNIDEIHKYDSDDSLPDIGYSDLIRRENGHVASPTLYKDLCDSGSALTKQHGELSKERGDLTDAHGNSQITRFDASDLTASNNLDNQISLPRSENTDENREKRNFFQTQNYDIVEKDDDNDDSFRIDVTFKKQTKKKNKKQPLKVNNGQITNKAFGSLKRFDDSTFKKPGSRNRKNKRRDSQIQVTPENMDTWWLKSGTKKEKRVSEVIDLVAIEEKMEESLKSVLSVSDLAEDQLQYLTQANEGYLRKIFQGKRPSQRHTEYKSSTALRARMTYLVSYGDFSEESLEIVMDTLVPMFCKKGSKYLDYVSKVLLPELLVKICMDVLHVNYEEATKMF